MAVYLNPEAFKDKTIPPIKNKEHIINTTYTELKGWIDSSQLIPGMQYRITDYVTECKIYDDYSTSLLKIKSAEHPFDIIVTANSVNKLNFKAKAIQHEGDTYFKNSSLESWQLWYNINNRNGSTKGIVERLIDEYNNDVNYDFKNIMFGVYELSYYNLSDDTMIYWKSELDEDYNFIEFKYLYTFSNITTEIKDYSMSFNVKNNIIRIDDFVTDKDFAITALLSSNSYGSLIMDNKIYNSYIIISERYDISDNIIKNSRIGIINSCVNNIIENSHFDADPKLNCNKIKYCKIINSNYIYYTIIEDCNIYKSNYIYFGSKSYRGKYYRNIKINNCKYISLYNIETASSNNQVQNYNINNILNSSETIINVSRNRNFETKVGRNSNGVIKEYCIEDLIA